MIENTQTAISASLLGHMRQRIIQVIPTL